MRHNRFSLWLLYGIALSVLVSGLYMYRSALYAQTSQRGIMAPQANFFYDWLALGGEPRTVNGGILDVNGPVKFSQITWASFLATDANGNVVKGPDTMPAWAVMAFDLSECPSGWSRFSDADDRFIMGATTNSKEKWGSGLAKLVIKNIPPHSHYYKDTVYAENRTANLDGSNYHRTVNGYKWLDASNKDMYYGVTFSHEMLGSSATDKDNDPIYWVRGSSMQLCDFWYRDQTYVYGNRGDVDINGWFLNMLDLRTKLDASCTSDYSSSNTSFSVQNAYVKLLYCRKD